MLKLHLRSARNRVESFRRPAGKRGVMTLHTDIATTMKQGNTQAEFTLTVVFREVEDENGKYFVAECLEMPGCVSQGDTQEEASRNIQDAMRACLSVVFEDCVKQIMARHAFPDLRGISSQERLTIDPTPHLEYA